ncbi:hypothetical protein EN828_25205 [Mesorhizobium sp. M2D.F.Ca.ET.185.01.1.1]|uniref:hypothetical protein n=1 Tax=unclassified Mesorhizobium TaxID=325217 RepID=UPI000FC99CF6|nr:MULTISPECIES: hypothetical protein [unclassified Mesorhizobium]TGP74350.1 hypothetical protein EN870_27025 [bacterium M00.F.Ca.ET.227.01.1.1]TGP85036.1 hypothetical protein EN864_27130 [bacterium M00.F.Ca.ET.221.01.1.1]TGP89119.1 hypothetical protein EN865_25555 [bacterium M00.F.Ca.ET.222.01.1.1]TGU12823.1 hypothetical protein EN806_15710 [bacterium M00.F.Ca.ET.163.01.1.1]TGU21274.1 hypothetical protein EN799_53890 [bacterium M00.F.Ca.ET.156.01.1.1]TGU43671.1 hypothetical protein EN789_261
MPLREQGVVDAIEAWLQANGFSAVKAIKAGARGYDIAATRGDTGERWLIEAKGGAYSGADTSNDAWSRTGAAFLMTAGWRFQNDIPGERFAIGIPSSRWFDIHLRRMSPALEYLGISVFQVRDEGTVTFTENRPRTE